MSTIPESAPRSNADSVDLGLVNQSVEHAVDLREAIYNDQTIGPISKVQLPAERITTLHGILFDLDPKLYAPTNIIFPRADSPAAFYEEIKPVLDRHPLARSAEVRVSGTGLHLICWLRPAVELRSAADQRRWAAIVKAVQCTLPVDPHMPGITAVTRPVGSVNGKSGVKVEMLRAGEAIDPKAVEDYLARVVRSPFLEVALPLLGEERDQPCPVCKGEGTRLDVLDRVGSCYGSCGKVTLARLYDAIFLPRKGGKEPGRKKQNDPETASSNQKCDV